MVHIARLKHQKGSLAWINIRTIEGKVLGRSHEWSVGLDILERTGFITKVLSLEKNHREVGRHDAGSSVFDPRRGR